MGSCSVQPVVAVKALLIHSKSAIQHWPLTAGHFACNIWVRLSLLRLHPAKTGWPKTMTSTHSEINGFDRFLWWLSTAEPELIHDCTVDRNRYRITGFIVLCTWLFATLAWTYFFSTSIDSPYSYLPLGLFMGFIILSIDRALIKGINKKNKNKFLPLAFRGLLALTIGLFMAQPAVLYLFDKEVKMQASIDNEQRKMVKRQQLDSLYASQKAETERQIGVLQTQLDSSAAAVDRARISYIQEADGSGGTGKVGISTIALAKRAEYLKIDTIHRQMILRQQPLIDSMRSYLGTIETNIKEQEAQFATLLNHGFLTRIEGMQNLVKANDAVASRYYLIIAILMLIELMPVIAKMMLPSGPYEEKIGMTEEREKEMFLRNLDREDALKTYFNDTAHDNDRKAIDSFFDLNHERRVAKMDEMGEKWSGDKYQSFDGLWNKVKREVFTKMEG